MDISIREHIINNFKEDSEESIYESVKNGEEVTLPGLGVFMSIIWENSSDEDKEKLVKCLKRAL
mgnify:CR=1 FL=1